MQTETLLGFENIAGFDSHIREGGAWGRTRMLYRLGRLLQLVGMVVLPLAIVAQIAPDHQISLGTSLTFSGIGVAIFFMGWLIQQAGRRR